MLKNLTFFLFIPWLLFQTVTGQETKIVWIQKEPGVIDSGRCFEVDKKINLKNYKGQKIFQYVKEIPTKKCLPKNKTSYIFIFSVGRCFEGDTETQGQNYFSYSSTKNCKSKNISYKTMNKTGVAKCYEVDTLTMGSRYYRSVESKNCISESTRFTWVPTSDKSGRCFSIDLRTGVKSKVKRDDCRPENPIYEFVRTGPFKGYCLEKSINAENAYAQKSKIEKCKPTETSYIFYKAEGEMSGKCYELDIESNGNNYLDKVDAKYCK